MKANLNDLGFSKGIITEAIVSTYNRDGKPNAAPMGVIMEDEQHLSINFYNSSTTFKNIEANRWAVVNLTNNIELFYKTAFKEVNPDGRIPQEWFEKTKTRNAPRLGLADATIDISVKNFIPTSSDKTYTIFKTEMMQAALKYPQVYCRAMSLTLEAILHATRLKAFINNEKEQKHVNKLLELIENSNEVVNRVAPNSTYSKIMAELRKSIDLWRNTQ